MLPHQLGYLLLGQPEIAEQTMRALELKGDLPQLVDPKLQLGITLDDWSAPEYRWLRRERLHEFSLNLGAVAAQFGQVFLTVPVATPTIAVVEKIIISNPAVTAGLFHWGIVNTVTGFTVGISGSGTRDGRYFGTPAASTVGALQAAIQLLPSPSGRIHLNAGASIAIDVEYVLTNKLFNPGANPLGFVIETALVNQQMAAGFSWRERKLLTSEAT